MPNQLPHNQTPNGFDNLAVDVAELHRRFPVERPGDLGIPWSSPVDRLYFTPFLPLSVRNYAWHFLRRIRLDISWFARFKRYWGKVLGGRPLWGVEDFYFLRNLYRMRFQSGSAPDTTNTDLHLEAWQRPEMLSHLFHSVYKESLTNELRLWKPVRSLHQGTIKSTLEFGCGSAPITTTLCEFAPIRNVEAWISDIETVTFHYSACKLSPFKNVHAVPLRPEKQFRFPSEQKFDVIFCMTVLEHLQEPLAVFQHLHSLLAPKGLIVFDYVKSDASGYDTQAGLDQRPAVLDYVRNHFHILMGRLDPEHDMGTTIITPLIR